MFRSGLVWLDIAKRQADLTRRLGDHDGGRAVAAAASHADCDLSTYQAKERQVLAMDAQPEPGELAAIRA
jgi:hypothetical protein